MRYLVFAYYMILFLSSISAIKNFKKLPKSFKIFGLLVVCTFVFELLAFYLAKTRHNNIVVYVSWMPIEVILMVWAYYTFHTDSVFRKTTVALMLLFLIYFISELVGLNFKVFPNNLIMIENIVLYAIAAYSSYLILRKQLYIEIKKNCMIWINMGLLFFLSTTFFVWGFNHLIKTNEVNLISRVTLVISNIVLYSIFAMSFFKINLHSDVE